MVEMPRRRDEPVPAWSSERLRGSLRRWGHQVRREAVSRSRRLAPRRLPGPAHGLVVGCWAVAAALAVMYLAPGLLPLDATPLFPLPGWFTVSLYAAMAVVAAAGGMAAAYLGRHARSAVPALAAAAVAEAVTVIPMSAFVQTRQWGHVLVVAGALLGGAGALAWTAMTRRRSRGGLGVALVVLVAALAATPWLLVMAAARDEFSLAVATTSSLLGLIAVVFITVAAAGAVAFSIESRHAHARRWLTREPTLRLVLATSGVMALLLWLRFTVADGVFSTGEDQLWSIRGWRSWPHAVLVAAVMVLVARRSCSRPLASDGQRTVTCLLLVGAVSAPLLSLVDSLVGLIRSGVAGEVRPPSNLIDHYALVSVAFVLATAWPLVDRRFANTAGRAMAVVSLCYLLPAMVGQVADGETDWTPPAVWCTPAQVVVALTALVGGLAVVELVSARPLLPRRAALALLVVPAVAVQGADLLPGLVSEPLARPLVVVGVTVGLVWTMPPVAADPFRHARVQLVASATALATVAAFVLSTALDLPVSDTVSALLAVLWLAVPLAAVLCCRVDARRYVSRAGS